RFMRERAAYVADLAWGIERLQRYAARDGQKLCIRLNGSSDISWEAQGCVRGGLRHRNLFEAFPDVAFVDYTKNPRRFDRALPANYHLTFSRSESNERHALALLARGVNVAVVFEAIPDTWHGFTVIDGDKHDLRQLDPRAA